MVSGFGVSGFRLPGLGFAAGLKVFGLGAPLLLRGGMPNWVLECHA